MHGAPPHSLVEAPPQGHGFARICLSDAGLPRIFVAHGTFLRARRTAASISSHSGVHTLWLKT